MARARRELGGAVGSAFPMLRRRAFPTGVVSLACLLAAAAAPTPLPAQSAPVEVEIGAVLTELEPEIRRAMLEGRIPGLSIALVAGDRVVWSAGYGESNLRARTPAAASTVYIIASTLKTMAATALLQLMDEGRFELDDPVSPYLDGLRIRGEDPDDPVTFRHLLTHTSGLPTAFSPVPVWADTVPSPIEDYLRERLEVVGPPMKEVRYSNMAFTLVAHLVEQLSGVDFRGFMQERIFDPLGMESTAFAPTPEMEERLAVPYAPSGEGGALVPVSRVRFAEWPAGGAWGTVHDQARWLIANLNGGAYGDARILLDSTLALMHEGQFRQFRRPMAGGWGGRRAGYGLAWWTTRRGRENYIAHSGSVRGYTAFIHGNLDRRLGVAILTNGNRAHEHLVRLSFLATDLMAEHSR